MHRSARRLLVALCALTARPLVASAQESPPPPRPIALDGAAFVGAGYETEGLEGGAALGVELALRHRFERWSGAIGLRVRYERYSRSPDELYALSEHMVTVCLPLTARGKLGWVLPYAGIAPGVVADIAVPSAIDASHPAPPTSTFARASLDAFAGAELRATDEGRFFLEVGYRIATDERRPWGDTHLGTFLAVAGWRGQLW